VGSGNAECGRQRTEGIECGLRPVGAIGAYAPEGSGNRKEFGSWNSEGG